MQYTSILCTGSTTFCLTMRIAWRGVSAPNALIRNGRQSRKRPGGQFMSRRRFRTGIYFPSLNLKGERLTSFFSHELSVESKHASKPQLNCLRLNISSLDTIFLLMQRTVRIFYVCMKLALHSDFLYHDHTEYTYHRFAQIYCTKEKFSLSIEYV